MKYCSRCGALLGTIREPGGRERPACTACGQVVYRNALPVAMVVPRLGERILLVQRVTPPLTGFWAPPGGYVEADESLEEAARRETREEAGVDVRLTGLGGVYSDPGIILTVFWGEVTGGDPQSGDDAAAVGLFAPADLPLAPLLQESHPLDRWFHGVLTELYARIARGEQPEAGPRGQAAPVGRSRRLGTPLSRPRNLSVGAETWRRCGS